MDTRKRRKEGGSSQSLVFESLQSLPKRAKVHAQRKFAQGTQPNSPAVTPIKEFRELRDRIIPTECRTRLGLSSSSYPVNTTHQALTTTPSLTSASTRPKTEDFLTFLCFRRTALLPPELELFETPQQLEASAEVQRITPPQEDKITKPFKKKDDFSYDINDKKEVTLFQDSYNNKANIDQIEDENQSQIPSPRVTRSSASLTPTPSFLSSPPSSDYSPQDQSPKRKLTRKQMLLKKAMLLKSKSLNARRRCVQMQFRSKGEKRSIITRSDSTKEPGASLLSISAKKKTGKPGKVFFLKRKQEQISRVLKRLGTPIILSPSEKGRVTRSRIETNEDLEEDETKNVKRKSVDSVESCSIKEEKLIKQEENAEEKSKEKKVVENSEITLTNSNKVLSPKRGFGVLKNLSCKEVLKKRKLKPVERRVTRRLIYTGDKKEEISNVEAPAECNLKLRCTRSASDVLITDVKTPSEVVTTPERSKSLDEFQESSKRVIRSKSSEMTDNQTPQELEHCSSLRNRPIRKTKQVAEVYMELISQRLAKESQKGKDLSDEDIEDDNISISSIKELKAFSKRSKNKEINVEKCLQEIAEKHEKEIKHSVSDSKEKLPSKVGVVKRALKEKPHQGTKTKVQSDEAPKMDLRSSSIIFIEETNNSSSGNTNKKTRGSNISPTRKSVSSNKIGSTEQSDSVIETRRSESRSPRLSRASQGGVKSPKHLTPVRNDISFSTSQSPNDSSVLSSQSLQSPSSRSPQLQKKLNSQVSPKPLPRKCLDTNNEETSSKCLRRRASEEVAKTKKKEIIRRLSYDSKSKKNESEEDKITETTSPNLRRREISTKAIKECSVIKRSKESESNNRKIQLKNVCNDNKETEKDSLGNKLALPLIEKNIKVENKTIECTSKIGKLSIDVPKIEISKEEKISESAAIENLEASIEKTCIDSISESSKCSRFPKRVTKPKCLPISPRSKRTASLDGGQISLKCDRLKRKFGSMESVISNCEGNECEASSETESNTSVQNIFSSQFKSNTLKEMKIKMSESTSQSRKPNFSRRRSSLHDEAKLNAVLESVAKDFEKDMDDQLFDKIEKDLNAGNKSPDKANRSFMETLKSKPNLLIDKDSVSLSIDLHSRASPVAQSSSSSSSPVASRKSNSSKKLSDVVRNLQERKQAESPHSFIDSGTPPFLQDLKSLDSRNLEKSKQVSEEAVVSQPFDLAPAPSISHPADVADINSLVTLNSSTHPCTSDYKALQGTPTKSIECNIDEKEIISTQTISPLIERESTLPLAVTPSISQTESKPNAVIALNTSNNNNNNNNSNNNNNIALTTYVPFQSVNAEPVLTMPLTNMNIAVPKVALNARPLSSIRPSSNISVANNQLSANLISTRLAHLGHGVTLAAASVPQAAVLTEVPKSSKSDQASKSNSKQILIAPKPSRTSSPVVNSKQGLTALKNVPKPIQIAPKLPVNTSGTSVTGHIHSSSPILPVSQMGHVIQGVPHQMQAMQPLQQALPTVQTISQGVQPLQAITQNFPTIAGMNATVQAVITQTMAMNHNQLLTPSSPAKILTQPVFVTSSMPSMVGTPFDITMQSHLHSNVGTVARVVAQNVVGKVAPKPQSPLVNSGTQSLVTLAPGCIDTNVIPSIVPFHQSLHSGQPTQFVAVNMMPVASQISLQGPRHITSNQMGPILCPQTMACIASSAGVPSVSTSLNLIPHGSIVTCPIPDVNSGMCNASLLQPLQCMPINTQATRAMTSVPSSSLENSSPVTIQTSNTELYSEGMEKILNTEYEDDDVEIPEPQDLEVYDEETSSNCSNKELSIDDCIEESHDSDENKLEENSISDVVLSTKIASSVPLIQDSLSFKEKVGLNLKSEKVTTEKKNSLLPKYPMGASPVVSHALSKLFPVSEPSEGLFTLENNSKSSLDSSQSTFSKQDSIKPLPSHMIFSNFVYTTTSIVIPKMSDQSMTSPKAVTKVSQSSPPYVLSTSTSNEVLMKPTLIDSKTSHFNHSVDSPLSPPVSLDQDRKNFVTSNSGVSSSIQCQNSIANTKNSMKPFDTLPLSQSETAKLFGNIASSSVTISISPKVNSSPIDKSNENKLIQKKIYTSNQLNKIYNEGDKKSHNLLGGKTAITLTPSTSLENKMKSKVQNTFNSTSVLDSSINKQNKNDAEKFSPKNKSNNSIVGIHKKQTAVNDDKKLFNQLKDMEYKTEKKREPLFKKTLFKNKNSIEEKPSDAFSPLNESSVYAFEPETELPLEMTSPFSQRIKNIQPSPCISSIPKSSKLPHISHDVSLAKSKKSFFKTKKTDTINPTDNLKITQKLFRSNSLNSVNTVTVTATTTTITSTTVTTISTTNTGMLTTNSTFKNLTSVSSTKSIFNTISPPPSIKSAGIVSSISNKISICTASANTIKPINLDLPISSRKSTFSKSKEKIVSNLDSHQTENSEINMSKNEEKTFSENCNSKLLINLKEKDKRINEQNTSRAKLLERERKIEQLLPQLCLPERTITEDNIPQVDLKDLESESNDSEDLDIAEVNINTSQTKLTNSTSIAIQCDLDDSQSEKSQDELKGNENGTQTEGPSKFPLPPSASPFYYLPLAMATLGEKLPAQLVQQMLAKTQGLVGAAEAGMILQQAAQLAQQYKSSDDDEMPSLPPSSSVKPISPKSGSIALQKALKANLASIAQAEISVAQSSGLQISQPSSQSLLMFQTDNKETKLSTNTNTKNLLKVSNSLQGSVERNSDVTSPNKLHKPIPEKADKIPLPSKEKTTSDKTDIKSEIEGKVIKPTSNIKSMQVMKLKGKLSKPNEVLVKRRSGRSTTLAATKATESDLQEVEEMRRNRRAKRAAAILAKEESWSSSSEAPVSPIMSPDMLRGWPPPRLTSPTPSQSSEGTNASSSTVSQRSRMSGPHSRRHSPASSAESSRKHGRQTGSSNTFSTDPVLEPGPLRISDNPKLSRAPSFFPSEEEFSDPLDYIEKIRPEAEQFGLCRIVPPSNFRPECRVNDDMRFTAYKQYIHRMMRRWGPNDRILCAIKKCLAKQNIDLTFNPLIGGLELDLVQLYEVVERHGGLMKVIEKELWGKVADSLKIPKSTQDRLTKLDSIYCKYLLPYSTLSKEERENLLADVDSIHSRTSEERSKKSNDSSDEEDDEEEPLECIVKGKSTALSAFYRIARNIAGQWQPDPGGLQMDERYWEVVRESENYICVHTASIDTAEHGYGFPSQKTSPNAKHPWNLKNLCQNTNSVLRSMGNVIGVTAPTLHVGMMFSTVCWYRDPHSLPWIEYLHTGACKIWYGVSSNNEDKFRSALTKLVPDFIKSSPLWLPSDTAMVPPEDLVEEGVKVCRVVQEPGQFVVVFPGAFTSSVCSGYLISESAFFARPQYFDRAVSTFQTLAECCEPSMFSLDRLALSVASDAKATLEALARAKQVVLMVIEKEKKDRQAILQIGLTASERLSTPDLYRKRKSRFVEDDEENCCEICRQHLYVSLVTNTQEETVYCLQHAILFLTNNKSQLPFCKLMYTFSLPELTSILKQVDERIQTKTSAKKSSSALNKKGKFQEVDSLSSTSSSNF